MWTIPPKWIPKRKIENKLHQIHRANGEAVTRFADHVNNHSNSFIPRYCYCLLSSRVQYVFTTRRSFSRTSGPSSWSTIWLFHLIPSVMLFIFTNRSTSSLMMTVPSGLRILSISSRMFSASHLAKQRMNCQSLTEVVKRYLEKWIAAMTIDSS